MRVTVDGKGRIQLPLEVRRDLAIETGSDVEIENVVSDPITRDPALLITPVMPRCCVCGAQGVDLAPFGEPQRHVCVPCADAITSAPLAFPSG